MVDLEKIKDGWISDYVPVLDISKIKWTILNHLDLFRFLITNYYHDKEYIALPKLDGDELVPLGLTYTFFNDYKDYNNPNYLISYIENKKGYKTILTCFKYYENYKSCDLDFCITYINYMETNFFYKRRGLFKLTIKKFLEIANLSDCVLTTPESIEGSVCQTVWHLKKELIEKNIMVSDDIFAFKKESLSKMKKLVK